MNYTRLFDILPYQLQNSPKDDALAYKEEGIWRKYSTKECVDIINQVSRAFIKYGIQKDDKIAIVSDSRPEWNFADLGMLQIGAVNVPVYPTISEADYKFIFNDAEVKIAFVSNMELFQKLSNIKSEVPTLKDIYTFVKVPGAKHWTEFLELGKDGDQGKVDELKAGVKEDDLATIIYTSGTTGTPKGVMLSHKNVVSNVKATVVRIPIEGNHRVLSFLPLCHIFERMVCYCYFAAGASVYYAESLETLVPNLQEVKPHFFTSVPRLLEKVYEKIVAKGMELEGTKRKLFFWALNLGLEYDEKGQNGLWYNIQLAIARKLIFSKWQEALGGNVIGIVTGAAALQFRLEKVFNAAGIKVRQGYGQTETSPVLTTNRVEEGEYILGTVGTAIEGVEVKIGENEEILGRGPNIMMGYYNRPDLTAESIDKDGWIHTGDQGKFIEYNGKQFLKITGRVKELFKTSGGKYVAPQVIENKLKESPYVEQLMVVGENEKFVSALIVPSFENLKGWSAKNGIEYKSNEDIVRHPEVVKLIQEEVDECNVNFGKVEQIKRFALLPGDWGIDTGELTPTMKVKRKVVMEMYKDEIAELYNV